MITSHLTLIGSRKLTIHDPVGIRNAIGEKKTVDGAGSSDHDRKAVRGNGPGADACADPRNKVIIQKPRSAPVSLQLVAEHEQGQHIKKYVKKPPVEKHVGYELPEHQLIGDPDGNQSEIEIDEITAEQMG